MINALVPAGGHTSQTCSGKGTISPLIAWGNGNFPGRIPDRAEGYAGINLGAAIGHISVDRPTQFDVDRGQTRQIALVSQQTSSTVNRCGVCLYPARIAYG